AVPPNAVRRSSADRLAGPLVASMESPGESCLPSRAHVDPVLQAIIPRSGDLRAGGGGEEGELADGSLRLGPALLVQERRAAYHGMTERQRPRARFNSWHPRP